MTKFLTFMRARQDLALIALMMISVTVMIIPLPTLLLDILIAVNIALTLLILVVAVYIKRPEEFTSFPAIILLATTFRLAITISTTRLILSQGDAGAIIDTFGTFVTRGSVLVGLVIFLVITTVQFIVITKGAERVAEVAARFTLDGLPGRQMSIDAELRNGDIDGPTAQRKRAKLDRENQFFGAMDGAMKFVKGDAIAGLIIVAINLIGGLSVGMLVNGMPLDAAVSLYSRLTVGDGLIGQIPALIVALCAGTIITRVNSGKDSDLGTEIVSQLTTGHKALFVSGGLVAMLAMVPGFPAMVFVCLGAALAGSGWYIMRSRQGAETASDNADQGAMLAPATAGKASTHKAQLSSIQAEAGSVVVISLGAAAYSAIDPATFAATRETELEAMYARTGLRMQPFGIQLDDTLEPNGVRLMLDGVPGFESVVEPAMLVAVTGPEILEINGIEGRKLEAKWGLRSAWWIDAGHASMLDAAQVETLPMSQLVAKTAARFMVRNASRIVGYKQIQAIIRELGAEHENLASQVSQTISAVQLLNLVRKLLREGVPLLPRRILFEALLEASVTSAGSEHLVRAARTALARQICATIADSNNVIAGYVIEPELENVLRESLSRNGEETALAPHQSVTAGLLENARKALHRHELGANAPIILTVDDLRWALGAFLRGNGIDVHVMAFHEITSEFSFTPVGTLSAPVEHWNSPLDYDEAA